MMAVILNLAMLHSAIIVFPLKLTHTCQDWFPLFAQKKTSLIHSDSTWWWLPSWTLPWWIQTLPSWIQTPCYLLSDSLQKHSDSILTLTQTNSIWFKLDDGILILNSGIMDSAILHKTLTPCWIQHWLKLIGFRLNLLMAAHHEFL